MALESPPPPPQESGFIINGNSEQNSFLLLKNVNQSTILLLSLGIHQSLQPKVQGLNGNSYELTKVLISDTAAYTGLNELFICSWKIFQLMLFQGRTRNVFKGLNVSEQIPVYL